MLPPCTPSRATITITRDEYDRLIAAERRLRAALPVVEWVEAQLSPAVYKHRGEYLREMCAAVHRRERRELWEGAVRAAFQAAGEG